MNGTLVRSVYGTPLVIPHDTSYWAVKLQSGRWCTERDRVDDPTYPTGKRPFDWSLDLVGTGDASRVKELWLLCPPTPFSPAGSTGRLDIAERGTPFQFKVKSTSGMYFVQRESQIVGRVDDKLTGRCTTFIWDDDLKVLSVPWITSVYDFGSWRDGIAPVRRLSAEVLGFSLS